jgi:hypothetical protein
MNISAVEIQIPQAQSVRVTSDTLHVDLSDGRTISVPLGLYPRLAHATVEERRECRLIAQGRGIHWTAIDEDISVEGLLAGRPPEKASRRSTDGWVRAKRVWPNGRPRHAEQPHAEFADELAIPPE